MAYKVKEIFYTLQGEGAQSGRPAVFCRFTGCNLWTGREKDRPKAICQFCDTDFWGMDGENGGKYKTAADLAKKVKSLWHTPSSKESSQTVGKPFVVCTGGEPALQLDKTLINAFHQEGLEIAIETNGTIELPLGIDWVCVSPKAHTEIVVKTGHELKLVYPQIGLLPEQFEHLNFTHFYLSPMDNALQKENMQKTVAFCLENPNWRLSLQTHKILNIP
jgi:7-carboxy-7-deazaguanine synthase